jgi:hypothetical protein
VNYELVRIGFLFSFLGWSGTESTFTDQPQAVVVMMMVMMCGAIGGMLGRGNRNTRRKPAPVPLCPPQIPHDLTRARTRDAAVESRRLTA